MTLTSGQPATTPPQPSPARSRLGINLAGPADWKTEHPFVDVFRFSRQWISQRQGEGWGKGSLTAEQILDRPTVQNLNNNNTFLALAETFAGFQENPTSGQNNPTASSGSSVNFNGAGTRGSTFQIDGVNNDDSSEIQNRQGVNLASIKEFQVISNTYSAEFGRGYGAVVLVQTKSGTNDVKGEVFYYRQDSQWNALSYGQLVKPDNQRPSYGGVVGFPILQNKLHGFASFERDPTIFVPGMVLSTGNAGAPGAARSPSAVGRRRSVLRAPNRMKFQAPLRAPRRGLPGSSVTGWPEPYARSDGRGDTTENIVEGERQSRRRLAAATRRAGPPSRSIGDRISPRRRWPCATGRLFC